jgi:hypothetical protein
MVFSFCVCFRRDCQTAAHSIEYAECLTMVGVLRFCVEVFLAVLNLSAGLAQIQKRDSVR